VAVRFLFEELMEDCGNIEFDCWF